MGARKSSALTSLRASEGQSVHPRQGTTIMLSGVLCARDIIKEGASPSWCSAGSAKLCLYYSGYRVRKEDSGAAADIIRAGWGPGTKARRDHYALTELVFEDSAGNAFAVPTRAIFFRDRHNLGGCGAAGNTQRASPSSPCWSGTNTLLLPKPTSGGRDPSKVIPQAVRLTASYNKGCSQKLGKFPRRI